VFSTAKNWMYTPLGLQNIMYFPLRGSACWARFRGSDLFLFITALNYYIIITIPGCIRSFLSDGLHTERHGSIVDSRIEPHTVFNRKTCILETTIAFLEAWMMKLSIANCYTKLKYSLYVDKEINTIGLMYFLFAWASK